MDEKIRNPFVALCDYASRNDWCWKISCTTCGHCHLKAGFSKLTHNQHPDDSLFWPNGKSDLDFWKEIYKYNDFQKFGSPTYMLSAQMKLANIVSKAKLSDIQAVAKFPDWLGYLGLVIIHCRNIKAQRIITDALLPQFISLVKDDLVVVEYLQKKQFEDELLSTKDLEMIENSIKK